MNLVPWRESQSPILAAKTEENPALITPKFTASTKLIDLFQHRTVHS